MNDSSGIPWGEELFGNSFLGSDSQSNELLLWMKSQVDAAGYQLFLNHFTEVHIILFSFSFIYLFNFFFSEFLSYRFGQQLADVQTACMSVLRYSEITSNKQLDNLQCRSISNCSIRFVNFGWFIYLIIFQNLNFLWQFVSILLQLEEIWWEIAHWSMFGLLNSTATMLWGFSVELFEPVDSEIDYIDWST